MSHKPAADLAAQTKRLEWELQTIKDIGAVLAGSLDLEAVIAGALQRLIDATGASGGSIHLLDAPGGAVGTRVALGAGPLREILLGRRPGDELPGDGVMEARAAVVVDDWGLRAATDAALRSAIAVPLLAGAELLGVLTLAAASPRRFDAADCRFLETIASQIAVALHNAQLHGLIRRAKTEWEQTVDAISDPIAVFDSRGELLRGNRALAVHLGMPVTGLGRLSCREVGLCGGHAAGEICAVAAALAQRETRAEIARADGQIFSVATFAIGAPSERSSVVQVAKNVTEEIQAARRLRRMSTELAAANERLVAALRELEAAQGRLVQTETLSSIGELVAGVAHELNNPLTSVIGYAQLVESELLDGAAERPPQEIAGDVRRITEESERAARIVRNLLTFARRQASDRRLVDVRELCASVLALRQHDLREHGIEARTECPPDLPPVWGDHGQLQQVLLNLILNAERAMRGSGVRRLTIRAAYEGRSQAIALSVGDSGHGIDPAHVARLFDPFFTTRAVGEGAGLGLSICYGVVRDHGGDIRIETRLREGTTVHVTLPAYSADPSVRGTEVLVAYGEPAEREFMSAALSGWGYRTSVAATTREALEISRRPGVALAVVDGRLLAEDLPAWRTARSAGARLPLVIAAVPPGDPAVAGFIREEAAGVLVKPVELSALRGAVRDRQRGSAYDRSATSARRG